MMDWQEVAIDGETRLKRLVDTYEELGLEICLKEAKPEEVEQCTQCLQESGEKIYRVYARRQQEAQE